MKNFRSDTICNITQVSLRKSAVNKYHQLLSKVLTGNRVSTSWQHLTPLSLLKRYDKLHVHEHMEAKMQEI